MQEEIKCPQCGGNKFSDRGNNTYKCMYCGSTFSTKKPEEVKPHETKKQANPSSNVTVNVNVDNPRQQKSQSNMGNQVAKGMAGGAGMAAGGCLTGNSCVEGCASALTGG